MVRIDPQRLIRLAVLIQHGSFRRAASHLGVTQPALSQSIAQIEKETGVELVKRTPHGVVPTVYGQVLYEHARAIDCKLAEAAQDIQELTLGQRGALKIGATVGGATSIVAVTLCKLHESKPGIDARITEEGTIKALLTQLHERTTDMLICQQPMEMDLHGVRAYPLFEVKRVMCVRAGHPLQGRLTPEGICGYPFVCPQAELGLLFGLNQVFATIGLEMPTRRLLVTNSLHCSKEIVLNSDAFAIFSDLSVLTERRLGMMEVLDLDASTAYWMQLILREEQTLTDEIKDFVSTLLSVCGEVGARVHPDAGGLFNLRTRRQTGQGASPASPKRG